MCIYKTSLLHRLDECIGFVPSCPPTFYNKIAPMVVRKTTFLECAMLTIFCALVLYYCACDMDHESVINE